MQREEKSLWLMVTGDAPEPVRIVRRSSGGDPLEGIMAFTNGGGVEVKVECQTDPEMHAIEVDPVQFCHQMAQNFPGEGIDLVFIDHEPHPLTHAGAKHALEVTGDLTWNVLRQDKDLVKESIRRLRRTLTTPDTDKDPYFRVTWASGLITSHPEGVQTQLEQGLNVYAYNNLTPGFPQLADMILPTNSESPVAPLLADVKGKGLRMFISDPEWIRPIINHMEYRGRPVVQFWVVAPGDGGIDLLSPV